MTCRKCNTPKATDEFGWVNKSLNKRHINCKICCRDLARYARYGITAEKYYELLEAQAGKCAICKSPDSGRTLRNGQGSALFVDHDHATDEVRGLLCSTCNTGLGYFHNNPQVLQNATDYLQHCR